MGVMPKRVATAVLVLIAWQESTSFGGFSPLAQPREPLRQTRASMADVLAAAEGTNLMTVVGNLQKGFDLLNGLNTAATNWEKWTDKSDPEYTRRGNKAKHVSDLVLSIKDNMKSNNNVMIPRVKLPEKQIRGTYIEQLMVAVLCDNVTGGLVAVHAESGSGKSVATMLAALEAGRSRPSDYYVVLQNNLNQRLCGFFRVSEASLMADIVDDFFFALRKEKIQLRLVFDNVLDSGATDDMNKDQLKALARAAGDWEHQVLFTMQEQEAAQSVADLNGATTRLAPQQDKAFGAYRWTQNEAEKLFQSLMSDSMPINMKKALAETKVPDEIGGWRPRDIKFFMTYGLKPVAPRRRMQAGTLVWVRQLRKENDDSGGFQFVGNAFQVKDKDMKNIDDLKEAIEKKERLAIAPSTIEILSRQEDGNWSKEEKMSEPLRDNDEATPYGYTVP